MEKTFRVCLLTDDHVTCSLHTPIDVFHLHTPACNCRGHIVPLMASIVTSADALVYGSDPVASLTLAKRLNKVIHFYARNPIAGTLDQRQRTEQSAAAAQAYRDSVLPIIAQSLIKDALAVVDEPPTQSDVNTKRTIQLTTALEPPPLDFVVDDTFTPAEIPLSSPIALNHLLPPLPTMIPLTMMTADDIRASGIAYDAPTMSRVDVHGNILRKHNRRGQATLSEESAAVPPSTILRRVQSTAQPPSITPAMAPPPPLLVPSPMPSPLPSRTPPTLVSVLPTPTIPTASPPHSPVAQPLPSPQSLKRDQSLTVAPTPTRKPSIVRVPRTSVTRVRTDDDTAQTTHVTRQGDTDEDRTTLAQLTSAPPSVPSPLPQPEPQPQPQPQPQPPALTSRVALLANDPKPQSFDRQPTLSAAPSLDPSVIAQFAQMQQFRQQQQQQQFMMGMSGYHPSYYPQQFMPSMPVMPHPMMPMMPPHYPLQHMPTMMFPTSMQSPAPFIPPTAPVTDRSYLQKDLFTRIRNNRHAAVSELLSGGMSVTITDEFLNSPLHIACQNGNKRMVKLLLRWGAHCDTRNIQGNTPLHYCFAFKYDSLGEYLISKGANENIENVFGYKCREAKLKPATTEESFELIDQHAALLPSGVTAQMARNSIAMPG